MSPKTASLAVLTSIVCVIALAGCSAAKTEPSSLGLPVPLATDSRAEVEKAVTQITTFPTTLAPELFDSANQLKPSVREAALALVAKDVAASGIADLVVDEVELQGSIVSYEYDPASDFGIHVWVHSPSIPNEMLDDITDVYGDYLNIAQEPHVAYFGYPVEVSFWETGKDTASDLTNVPVYSLSSDSWVNKPIVQKDEFDSTAMLDDSMAFIGQYNTLAKAYSADKTGFACATFDDLSEEMRRYRSAAFDAGQGSRSTANLTYRVLRRININVPDTITQMSSDCTFVKESIYK